LPSFNNGYRGQTPVEAQTNAQGVATFTIRSRSGRPTRLLRANLVRSSLAYPYSYSPILAVRFRR
jgi:hypothetical protein